VPRWSLAEAQPLTHIEALELDEIPEHLLVIGGGYIGVELSQAMRRFGSKVTVIDRNGRLMSKEDPDGCEALRSLLADEGIDILLNARIKQVSGKCGDSVSVVAVREENYAEHQSKNRCCSVTVSTDHSGDHWNFPPYKPRSGRTVHKTNYPLRKDSFYRGTLGGLRLRSCCGSSYARIEFRMKFSILPQ
jgi:heterodisulfide reductase subunit A-like polyferredoxin